MDDALHSLVQALSKSEKRYFKLFAGQNVKQQHSLQTEMFDRLVAMEVYDEGGLLQWYGQAHNPSHLPAAKHQLRKLILRSLRAFGAGGSPFMDLQDRVREVKVLFEKRLYDQAEKLVRLSLKKAAVLEAYAVWSRLLEWEMDVLMALRPPDLVERIRACIQERALIFEEMQVEAQLRDAFTATLAISTLQLRRGNELVEQERERVMGLLARHGTGGSRLAVLLRTAVRGLLKLMEGQYAGARDIFLEAESVWDQVPGFILEHEEFFMQFQFNLLNSCLYSESPDQLREQLEKVKKRLPQLKGDLLKHQQKVYFIELLYVMNYGSGFEADIRVAGILRWMNRNSDRITTSSLYFFHYNCSIYFFLSGDPSQSLAHTNWILNFNPAEIRVDMKAFARLFQLVLHFELENTDFIEYRLRGLRRRARTDFQPEGLENSLLIFFEQLLKLPPREESAKFCELKEIINAQVAAAKGRPPLGHQELLYWVESRIQRKPLAEIYREGRQLN